MNVKRAGETRTILVDLASKLISPELLTGTPTVTELATSDLTISNIELTASPDPPIGSLFSFGAYIPTSRGVSFSVSGGVAGLTYTIRVQVGTDATAAQSLIRDVELMVN